MKSFEQFIFESKLSKEDALKILGIKSVESQSDLKKAFKRASLKSHPDKGGSDEAMQQVNAAYEVLQKHNDKTTSSMDWDAVKRDNKDRAEAWTDYVTGQLTRHFDIEEYTDYLSEQVDQRLGFEKVIKTGVGLYTYATYKWKSLDSKIVFSLEMSFRNESSQSGLADNTDGITLGEINYSTEVMINRKKVKMTQANYVFGAKSKNIFKDPKVAFPKAKINKAMKDSNKALKRADYMLTFKNELKADVSGNVIRVPLPKVLDDKGNPMKVVMERSTFMRKGLYNIHDIRGDRGVKMDKGQYGYGSCWESTDQVVLGKLVDILQKAQSFKDLDKVINYLAKECKDLNEWSGDFI